jgi:signal peptidase I
LKIYNLKFKPFVLLLKGGIILIGLLASLALIRLCFFDVFNIPSESMRDLLKTNDLVVINKTFYSGWLSPLFYRLGHHELKQNDVVVFKLDANDDTYYIKRCVGVAGSEIKIINGIVYINGKPIVEPPTVRQSYKIWYQNYTSLESFFDKNNISMYNFSYRRYPHYLYISLTTKHRDLVASSSPIDSIKLNVSDENLVLPIGDRSVDIYNLKSLYIPFKGMKITLNNENMSRYADVIRKYEGVTIKTKNFKYFIDQNPVQYYTFKQSYYFLMGDNRDDSVDSRYFGIIPQKNITGNYLFKSNL